MWWRRRNGCKGKSAGRMMIKIRDSREEKEGWRKRNDGKIKSKIALSFVLVRYSSGWSLFMQCWLRVLLLLPLLLLFLVLPLP